MNKKEQIYIFGHRSPDTDSVSSAISLAYLKKALGKNAIPTILSPINNETKYALNYFQVKEPRLIDDVKIKVKDLSYSKDYTMREHESIYDAYNHMSRIGISKIPVIDRKKTMLGIVSMKDIAKAQFSPKYNEVDTTYENVLKVLEGEPILKNETDIKGNLIVAAYKSTTFIDGINLDKDNILIVGDRHSVIEYAVNSGIKLLILTGGHQIKEHHLETAKENNVSIISTKYDTLQTTRIFNLCNKVSTIMNNNKILCINENEDLSEFIKIANKTRYSYYPVLNNAGKCLGILRFSDVGYNNKKNVILVDHNAYDQSAVGLDEANILEVIDHHNISTIVTGAPISFRTMPVGSTCTIIYNMFVENNISIPKYIAGMLISGILSDTLILTSPTTTDLDKEAVTALEKIAKVNHQEYGLEMIKAGTSIEGKTKNEVINNDIKVFPTNDLKFCISQFFTLNIDSIAKEQDEYIQILNDIANKNNYEFVIFIVTDIIKNGSYVFYSNRAERLLSHIFNLDSIAQGTFIGGLVSRKKQLVPFVIDEMKK